MSRRQNALDRGVARLMSLDSPVYGDERERGVFMEASAFGVTIGIYASLLGAVVAAVLGQLLLPVVLVLATFVPSVAAMWYAGRRGVELEELARRGSLRDRLVHTLVVFGALVLVLASMLYTVFTGHGLIEVPAVELEATSGVLQSLVKGALIGGIGGGIVGVVMTARRSRRVARDRDPVADEE
ncbi:hypothetical protein [Georgenia subflava]|uniref:Uncharacterized protein n=1 Tax=Georgenia subflava TaxID=1622177 RepID=A0A6N7ECH3_9MICO|nr:hypothetical protein [Georgenia subflava]MPV36122.1 hypothetical protein [Georgenia subflava]